MPRFDRVGDVGQLGLSLRRASERDYRQVQELIKDATHWLRTMSTDQWAKPWPSEEGRKRRIQAAIQAGQTWIVWDSALPVATVTASREDHEIWPPEKHRDPAVYVARLVVRRQYSGRGLGAELLDWSGLRANRHYGARWVRVDVWRTNAKLHAYYRQQGFEFYGFCESIDDYPSSALFQKRTDQIVPLDQPSFREEAR
jgi:GNAT superfamily N-acetyltransferase